MRNRRPSLAPALLLLLPLVLFSEVAQAHPGHDGLASFFSGLLHPLTGLDHLLAMFCVGLWAAPRRSLLEFRTALTLPLVFVACASLGTGLGLAGLLDARIEMVVAGSLLPLGLALLCGLRVEQGLALCLIAVCGVVHGGAHGRELASAASAASGEVVAGFLIGTALLHAAGAGLALAVPRARQRLVLASAGGGLSAAGLWLLAS